MVMLSFNDTSTVTGELSQLHCNFTTYKIIWKLLTRTNLFFALLTLVAFGKRCYMAAAATTCRTYYHYNNSMRWWWLCKLFPHRFANKSQSNSTVINANLSSSNGPATKFAACSIWPIWQWQDTVVDDVVV